MSILIYRNSEEGVYKISIEAFEKRVRIKYIDALVLKSPNTDKNS